MELTPLPGQPGTTIISPLAASGPNYIPASQNPAYQNWLAQGNTGSPMGNSGPATTYYAPLQPPKVDSTSYSYIPPLGNLNVGNNLMYGTSLNQNTPGIQSLISGGYAVPNQNNTGVIVTKAPISPYKQSIGFNGPPTEPQGITGSQYSQSVGGGAIPTLSGQPSVPYNYDVQPLTPETKTALDTSLRHQLSLTVGSDRIPKDLTPYINAMKFGGYTAQDVANALTEIARTGKSNIINPTVQRWHWIVGGQYGTGGGDTSGASGGYGAGGGSSGGLSNPPTSGAPYDRTSGLMDTLVGLQMPDSMGVPMPTDPSIAQRDFLQREAEQKAMNEQTMKSTVAGIQSEYDNAMRATSLKFDQDIAKSTASLSRMGALGTTTASSSYLQGLEQQKQQAINDLTQKKEAAIAAAVQAQMTGDWKAAKEAKDSFYKAQTEYDTQSGLRYNTRNDAAQKAINTFQAVSGNLLGALGKSLEAQGLDITQQNADTASLRLQSDIQQADQRFQFDVQKFGIEQARKNLELAGFAQMADGSLMPTVARMTLALKQAAGSGKGGGETAYTPGGNNSSLLPYLSQQPDGTYAVNADMINNMVSTTKENRQKVYESAYSYANELNSKGATAAGATTGATGTMDFNTFVNSNPSYKWLTQQQQQQQYLTYQNAVSGNNTRLPGESNSTYLQRQSYGPNPNLVDQAKLGIMKFGDWLSQ